MNQAVFNMLCGGKLFDMFVDFIDGLDANSGSKASPKKTITGALATGKNKIGLKPGVSWDEYVTIDRTGVFIKPYASGFAEINSLYTLVNWTKTDGYTNVYECAIPTLTQAASNNIVRQVFVYDLSRITLEPYSCMSYISRATSLANCDASENTFWTLTISASINKIYIHVTGGADPTTLNYTYKIAKEGRQFFAGDVGNNAVSYERLILHPALNTSASSLGYANCKKLFFNGCNSAHHFVSAGGILENIVVVNSAPYEDIAYVNYQTNGGLDVSYINSLFINVRNAYAAHISTGLLGNQNLQNNFFWSVLGTGVAMTSSNNDPTKNTIIKNAFVQGFLKAYSGGTNTAIDDCIFLDCGYGVNPADVGGRQITCRNILMRCSLSFYTAAVGSNFIFENNTCHLRSDVTTTIATAFQKNSGIIRRNIIIMDAYNNVTNSGTSRLYMTPAHSSSAEAIASTQEIDYNVYILASGNPDNVMWGFLLWTSLATWQTQTGKDTHSIYIDLTSKGGFSYLFNDDYTMKDVPERAQVLAVGAGLTKTPRTFPVKPTYEEAFSMLQNDTIDNFTRDLFV